MSKTLCALVIVASLFVSIALSIEHAATKETFIDEIRSVEEARNFLSRGLFTVKPDGELKGGFDPEGSIGIASNWASGLGWNLTGSLFETRVFVIFYHFVLAFILFWFLTGHFILTSWERWALTLAGWAACLVHVPYAMTAQIQSLGEVSGAMLLGIAMLWRGNIGRALLLGICVWHTKFIFLPFALVALFLGGDRRFHPSSILMKIFFFHLPIWGWILLIFVQTGPDGLAYWLSNRMNFIVGGGSSLNALPRFLAQGLSFLAHPDWVMLPLGVRAKVTLLTMGSMVGFVALMRRGHFLLLTGMLAAHIVFISWFFLWKESLWIRHILPAMLVGFGALWIWFLDLFEGQGLVGRKVLLALLILVISIPAFRASLGSKFFADFSFRHPELVFCRGSNVGPYEIPDCNPNTRR